MGARNETLGKLIAYPPFPALLAISIALGMARLAVSVTQMIRPKTNFYLDFAGSFGLVTAAICGLIHLLALVGLGSNFPRVLQARYDYALVRFQDGSTD